MIRILKDGKMLDIQQSLLVELSSSFFESEVLTGSFSYPIQLPWTRHNQQILGTEREVSVVLDVDGLFVKNCVLNFKRKKDTCSGYLKFDLGELITEMKKDIRLLVDEKVVFDLGASNISAVMLAYVQREPSTVPVVFYPIKNMAFMETTEEMVGEFPWYQNMGYQNFFRYGGFEVGLNTPDYQTVPGVYLVWLLTACFSKLGYELKGEFVEDPEVRRWVLDCNTAVNFGAETGVNLYSFWVWKCLPSTSLVDLLKALREFEGVGCFVDAKLKTVTLSRMVSAVEGREFVDLRGCELVNFEYGFTESGGYVVNQFVEDKDVTWKTKKYRKNFQIGSGGTEVNLKIGTVMMIKEDRPFGAPGAKWLVPHVERPGNLLSISYFKSASYVADTNDKAMFKLTNEPSLRLLSYRGLVEDSTGELYPLATSIQTDINDDAIGSRMLQFDGGTGQWYTSLDKYYGFLHRGNPLQIDLLLPLGKVYELTDTSKKVMLTVDKEDKYFFMKRLQVEFPSKNGKVKVKADAVEIVNNDIVPMPVITPTIMVYVVIAEENVVSEGVGTGHYIRYADIVIRLYLDAELTEAAEVDDLTVYVRATDSAVGTEEYNFTVNASSLVIETGKMVFEEYSDNAGTVISQYSRFYSVVANENYYLG